MGLLCNCSGEPKYWHTAASHDIKYTPKLRDSARRPISRVLSSSRRTMDGHSSGTSVTGRLARPTRKAMRKPIRGPKPQAFPIRSCSRWGLPCHARHRARGALLPHPFTLTGRPRGVSAVCFLWHFPWGRPRRTLSGTVFP